MIETSDRIKMLKYRLANPNLDDKERLKILDLLDRAYQPYESATDLTNWFKDLKKISEDLIKDERY
tara:strand:+ start:363 stop:560 length:198 start_codon:yes stop_codon:yes gene_type:complete